MPIYRVNDRDIHTVPNQRIVSINKAPTDKTHLYTKNSLSALDKAAKLESDGAFRLYIYLAKNQNNYAFALSSKAFFDWCGIGTGGYNTGFKELVEKGYLVKDKNIDVIYHFFEEPQESMEETIDDVLICYHTQKKNGFSF